MTLPPAGVATATSDIQATNRKRGCERAGEGAEGVGALTRKVLA